MQVSDHQLFTKFSFHSYAKEILNQLEDQVLTYHFNISL